MADFSGTKKACVFNAGAYSNFYFTRAVYNATLATTGNQTIAGIFEFGHADSAVSLYLHSNATFTEFIGFAIRRNGTFNGEYQGGGDGLSGSYTPPALDTPFEFELTVTAAGAYTAKIDGVAISTAVFGHPTTHLYGAVLLAEQAKMRTYFHGDTVVETGVAHSMSASGSGASTGSAAILIAVTIAMSAAGTGASTGSAGFQVTHGLTASGTGQSTGTATTVLDTPPTVAEFFGAGTLTANQAGTTISAALPASTTAGMVAVVAYMTNAGSTFSTPSGWTALGTAINSADQSTAFFVKRLTGGDAAPSTTTSVTQSATIGGYGRVYVWNFVGGTAANPLEDIGQVGVPTSNTTPQTAAVTTDGVSRLVACIVVVDDDNTWSSGMPPTNWVNIGGRLSSTVGGDCMMDAIQRAVPASGTTIAATTVGTQSAADFWRTITFALAPARLRMQADGTGQSDGSAAIEAAGGTAPLTMSASSDVGVTAGDASIHVAHGLTTAGTGTSTGAAAFVVNQALSASAPGQVTTGSVALLLLSAVATSGTGTSTGQATLRNVIPMSASGTGQSAGAAAFQGMVMSASGTGVSAGSVALISALALAPAGTGVSTGTAAISRGIPVNASGTGTSTGSVAISLFAGAINHSMQASGLGASSGSAALISTMTASASGTGISTGAALFLGTLPITASGTGVTDGSVAIRRLMPLASQGTGQSAGGVFLAMTLVLPGASGTGLSAGTAGIGRKISLPGASGTGLTIGSAAIGVSTGVTLSANGTGTTAGSAAIFITTYQIDIGVTIGELRADPHFTIGGMGLAAAAEVEDFSNVTVIGDLEATPPVTLDGFSPVTSVGPIREDK